MLKNREAITVNKYYSELKTEGITVIQDLWPTYKNAAKNHLKEAKIVADMFRVVRQVRWAFNRTRAAHIKKNAI
jgi:transposase